MTMVYDYGQRRPWLGSPWWSWSSSVMLNGVKPDGGIVRQIPGQPAAPPRSFTWQFSRLPWSTLDPLPHLWSVPVDHQFVSAGTIILRPNTFNVKSNLIPLWLLWVLFGGKTTHFNSNTCTEASAASMRFCTQVRNISGKLLMAKLFGESPNQRWLPRRRSLKKSFYKPRAPQAGKNSIFCSSRFLHILQCYGSRNLLLEYESTREVVRSNSQPLTTGGGRVSWEGFLPPNVLSLRDLHNHLAEFKTTHALLVKNTNRIFISHTHYYPLAPQVLLWY